MKIRTKITLSLGTILIVLGIVFNYAFRNEIIKQLENSMKASVSAIIDNTSETISFRLMNSNSENNKLIDESKYLVNYLSLNGDYKFEIYDNDFNDLGGNIDNKFKKDYKRLYHKSGKKSCFINIKYTKKKAYVELCYPIIYNNEYLGTCGIFKEFNKEYSETNNTIKDITIIEIVIFSAIFLIAFFIISTIIKPITKLTLGVKNVKDGNYDFTIKSKKKDEVGVLQTEFENMKDTIKNQIDTIKDEKKKVEALSNHRKQFFDNVTHEIKTPLTAITGYSEMLKDGMIDDEKFQERALERIHSESERVHQLVLDLISVSKGLSATKENYEKVEIKNIIEDILEDLKLKAKKYFLEFKYEIAPCILNVQKNRIKEVFINIIDNAIKYTSNDNVIYIKSFIHNNHYCFEIKNKCEKIPDEVFNKIFEPFVKTDNPNEAYSSGLGLYLSKEIINDNKGTIEIENGDYFKVKIKFKIKEENSPYEE